MPIDGSIYGILNTNFGQQLGDVFNPESIQLRQNKLAEAALDQKYKQMQMADSIAAHQDKLLAAKQRQQAMTGLHPDDLRAIQLGEPMDKVLENRRALNARADYQKRKEGVDIPLDYNPTEVSAQVAAMPDDAGKQELTKAMLESKFGIPAKRPLTHDEEVQAALEFGSSGVKGSEVPYKMIEINDKAAALKQSQLDKFAEAALARDEGAKNRMAQIQAAIAGRPAPAEKMVVVADAQGNPVYLPASQVSGMQSWNPKTASQINQKASAELTAQQALQEAADLYAHPGRSAGTGASSWMQKIPATDARGFGAHLETFKAKTFLDAVAAMKGMGALTEAEGARLVASAGALDPSMKEGEFAKNLQKATVEMYDKAKAKGFNVTLPSFAAGINQSAGAESSNVATGAIRRPTVSNW